VSGDQRPRFLSEVAVGDFVAAESPNLLTPVAHTDLCQNTGRFAAHEVASHDF
jgi:hypothetical protein